MKFGIVLALALVLALPARGQSTAEGSVRGEVRVDAIAERSTTAVQGGAGVQLPAGYYARVGVVAALGTDASASKGAARHLDGRVDVVGRFLLDPFRQSRWGLSVGAGVSVRSEYGKPLRPLLLTVADLEGPRSAGGVSPAFQVGLGGGVRVGMALRWGDRTVR